MTESIERSRKIARTQHMIGNDVVKLLKPEQRELCEDVTLIWNWSWKHNVECGEAIGGHKEQAVANLVEIAYLSARRDWQAREISLPNDVVSWY